MPQLIALGRLLESQAPHQRADDDRSRPGDVRAAAFTKLNLIIVVLYGDIRDTYLTEAITRQEN